MKICIDTEKIAGILASKKSLAKILEKLLITFQSTGCDGLVVDPEEPKPPQPPLSEFSHQEIHRMRWVSEHNRSFVWLPQTGSYYAGEDGKIKLTFNNGCPELLVNDASDNFRQYGGQPVYFCGTKNKPKESNGLRASVFSGVGCNASQVTIHFNK